MRNIKPKMFIAFQPFPWIFVSTAVKVFLLSVFTIITYKNLVLTYIERAMNGRQVSSRWGDVFAYSYFIYNIINGVENINTKHISC